LIKKILNTIKSSLQNEVTLSFDKGQVLLTSKENTQSFSTLIFVSHEGPNRVIEGIGEMDGPMINIKRVEIFSPTNIIDDDYFALLDTYFTYVFSKLQGHNKAIFRPRVTIVGRPKENIKDWELWARAVMGALKESGAREVNFED